MTIIDYIAAFLAYAAVFGSIAVLVGMAVRDRRERKIRDRSETRMYQKELEHFFVHSSEWKREAEVARRERDAAYHRKIQRHCRAAAYRERKPRKVK